MRTYPKTTLGSFLRRMAVRGIRGLRPSVPIDPHRKDAIRPPAHESGRVWRGKRDLDSHFTAFLRSLFLWLGSRSQGLLSEARPSAAQGARLAVCEPGRYSPNTGSAWNVARN